MKLNRERFLTAAFALATASGCGKLSDEISSLASPEPATSQAPQPQGSPPTQDPEQPFARPDTEEGSGTQGPSTVSNRSSSLSQRGLTSPTQEKGIINSPTAEKGVASPTNEATGKGKLPSPTLEVGAKKPLPSPTKEK